MDSKPNPTPITAALGDFSVLELAGRDAVAFAQAQLMNDLRSLAAGHWHWSGCLTAKGRVIALFALLRLDDERLYAVVPDMPAHALAAHLRRYVFRSKLELRPRDDLAVAGVFGDAAGVGPAAEGDRAGIDGERVALDFSGALARRLLVLPRARLDDAAADRSGDPAGRWRLEDLRHGLPRLAEHQRDAFTPQMLGLGRLNAFSLKKGCYPGQEIVARTHFLGQAKRGPALLAADRPLAAGATVRAGDADGGKLLCCADHGDEHLGIAIVTLPLVGPDVRIDGEPGRVLEFAAGLAR